MGAGDSAGRNADRARGAARRLEAKARFANKAADDWERGAAGERLTADALAELEGRGWRVLHDRRAPDGGNVDHVAIGPPGVAVIDAKNWAGTATVTPDQRVVVSKYDKTDEVDRLLHLADGVRTRLSREGVKVSVRGYLVLTGADDRGRPSSELGDLGDIRILGVDHLVRRLDSRRALLGPELVAAVAASIEAALPPMDGEAPAPAAPAAPSPLFDKGHRTYYVTTWRKFGHDRRYLKDRHGASLGWTDVNTGAVTIECTGDDEPYARTLLAAVDRAGIQMAPGDVPGRPKRLFGGRLLSRIARNRTAVLVGHEWWGHGHRRLYGTLLDPAIGTVELGWADLTTGALHPEEGAVLPSDRYDAGQYLAILLQGLPRREAPGRG